MSDNGIKLEDMDTSPHVPSSGSRKRRAEEDDNERPTSRHRSMRTASAVPIADDEDAVVQGSQALVVASTSNAAKESALVNFDPDVEARLERALEAIVKNKRNVFITGPAGSGKSYMIRELILRLRASRLTTGLVAPTGTAALNIGGCTIHRYFGLSVTLSKRSRAEAMMAIKSSAAKIRLDKVDVLIIDEISMVSNEMFERIGSMLQEIRTPNKPFGGIRVVAIGDFAQLPPVNGQSHCIDCGQERQLTARKFTCPRHGAVEHHDRWAFRSEQWHALRFRTIVLDKILRQSEREFSEIIMALWLGKSLSTQQMVTIKATRAVQEPALRLFATKAKVDRYNKSKWDRLTTPRIRYVCYDRFHLHDRHASRPWICRQGERTQPNNALACFKSHRYMEVLELRVGMPVILLHNINVGRGLVNGSLGTVVGFEAWEPGTTRSSGYDFGDTGYSHDDEGGLTSDGMFPSLGGTYNDFKHTNARMFWYKNSAYTLPKVKFANGLVKTIEPTCDVEEIDYDEAISQKHRTQVPLIAGWASTVHRAQGLTLDRVVVDLDSSFESGMQYVALSRARSLKGLKVLGLGSDGIQGHPSEVSDFMRRFLPNRLKKQMPPKSE